MRISSKATKPKRIKRVFTNHAQVLHLWANQAQDSARSANVFFEGDTCYSYGTHYVLGRFVTYRGTRVAVINDAGYSNTTRKHISSAWSAVAGQLRVCSSDLSVKNGLERWKKQIEDLLAGYLRARTFWREDTAASLLRDSDLTEYNKLCSALRLPAQRIKVSPTYQRKLNIHIKARVARQKELDATKELRREAERAERVKNGRAEIEAWRNGGPRTSAVGEVRPQILRIVKGSDDIRDIVETSGGAEVPLDDALKLLRRIVAGIAKRGDVVGSFKLDRIKGERITIGCHEIELSEARAVLLAQSAERSELTLLQGGAV